MNWVPICGDFTLNDSKIVFNGGTDNVLGNVQTKQGLILSDQKMLAGKIKVDIEFETKNLQINEEAELIFDYIDEYNFKCVGITGNTYKYEVKSCINGTWQYLRASGLVPTLSKEKLHIEVEIMPSYLRLIIDGVEIFSVNLMNSIRRTSIGIWASGGRRITFTDCDINSQLPEIFIISQFGDIYDQLYDGVIKPLCDKNNIKPIRADEISNSSVILDDIIKYIQTANIIIADITPNNPNVFYELGYAHAIGKEVILLCERDKRAGLPFDISGYRTIFYENTMIGKDKIEKEVGRYLKEALKRQGIL